MQIRALVIAMMFFSIAASQDCVFAQGNLTAPNRHNLSITGAGTVKASSETQICIFCHTPHAALTSGPLWNHTLSSATYTVSLPPGVTGSQLSTPENPPDGDSKLCLSCHDGTVSSGDVQNIGGGAGIISMGASMPAEGNGSSNLGRDIRGHHLVSIEVNADLNQAKNAQCGSTITFGVKGPASVSGPAILRNTSNCYPQPGCTKNPTNKGVQCTSCHDPHYDPIPGTTKFIRGATAGPASQPTYPAPSTWVFGDDLCLSCHCDCSVSGSCPL